MFGKTNVVNGKNSCYSRKYLIIFERIDSFLFMFHSKCVDFEIGSSKFDNLIAHSIKEKIAERFH